METNGRTRRAGRHEKSAYRRPGKRRLDGLRRLRLLTLLLAAGLLLVAAYLGIDYLRQGAAMRRLQAELRQQVAQHTVPPLSAEATAPANTEPPVSTEPPAPPALAVQPVGPTAYPFPVEGAPVLQRFQALLKKNSDLVGWLKADAISYVDFPIVKRDNSFACTGTFTATTMWRARCSWMRTTASCRWIRT